MKRDATIERWIGAVLAPQVRAPGTLASDSAIVPSREYLAQFPPALVVAFGRIPSGARAPRAELEFVRDACADAGHAAPLVACDLEQGAGLHFEDATRLPPALALASAALAQPDERAGLDWLVAAGALTGAEARERGVGLVLAPVADVTTQRANPIVAVRSFGDEPRSAAQRACAFLVGLHRAGVLACAKHFPGHGDTLVDTHLELARIERSRSGLHEIELAPFRALIEHAVDACMIGHLDVPALSGESGLPATLSRAVLEGVLRAELGFDGAIVSDAMDMGALARFERRYSRALAAGCDVLLCPHDPLAAVHELRASLMDGSLSAERLECAAERAFALRERQAWRAANGAPAGAQPASPRAPARGAARERRALSDDLARASLRWLGAPWSDARRFELVTSVPARVGPEFESAWTSLAHAWLPAHEPDAAALAVAVLESGAWRGSYGLDRDEEQQLFQTLAAGMDRRGRGVLVWFGSPQVLPAWALRDRRLSVLLAFAPTPPQVRAAAAVLFSKLVGPVPGATGVGSLPVRVG